MKYLAAFFIPFYFCFIYAVLDRSPEEVLVVEAEAIPAPTPPALVLPPAPVVDRTPVIVFVLDEFGQTTGNGLTTTRDLIRIEGSWLIITKPDGMAYLGGHGYLVIPEIVLPEVVPARAEEPSIE